MRVKRHLAISSNSVKRKYIDPKYEQAKLDNILNDIGKKSAELIALYSAANDIIEDGLDVDDRYVKAKMSFIKEQIETASKKMIESSDIIDKVERPPMKPKKAFKNLQKI